MTDGVNTRTYIEHRFLVDQQFIEEFIIRDGELWKKLMTVNINSKEHKKHHVKMSARSREELFKRHLEKEEYLRATVRSLDEPKLIEKEDDEMGSGNTEKQKKVSEEKF